MEQIEQIEQISYKQIILNSNLGEDTKKQYISCIERFLKEHPNISFTDVLCHPNKHIASLIQNKTTPIIICFIKSCLSLFRHSDLKETHCDIHKEWRQLFAPYSEKEKEKWESNIPSDRTMACNVTWSEIVSSYNETAKNSPYSLEHVTIALYTLIPPRRQTDYWKVLIIRNEDDRKKNNDDITGYLDMTTHPAQLSIVKYKTKKYYDIWKKTLPNIFDKILRKFIGNRTYLFQNRDGTPYKTHRAFAEINNRVLKKVTKNEKMSVNIIRHAAATFVHKHQTMPLKDKRQYALDMGHTYLTQSHYTIEN